MGMCFRIFRFVCR